MNNLSLNPIEQQIINGQIDWDFTTKWIQSNHTNLPTSEQLSKIQGSHIKKSNFIYPTLDILQKNYPKLYPTYILFCQECNTNPDTNSHTGSCTSHVNKINQLMDNFNQFD